MKILNQFSKKLTVSKVLAVLGIIWIVFILIAAFVNHLELKAQFENTQKKAASITASLQQAAPQSGFNMDQE